MKRESYVHYRTSANPQTDSLVVKSRSPKGERFISPGKWWINRNTPIGEDADWWERMPHQGKRQIDPRNIIAILKPCAPAS